VKPTWNPVGDWVQGLADDAISNLAKSIMEGMSQMVTTLSTFWVSMPTVNLISEDRTGASPVVSTVNSQLWPWTLTLAVLAVIIGGIRMIFSAPSSPSLWCPALAWVSSRS
jgi:type IV secretion system protein TrbL